MRRHAAADWLHGDSRHRGRSRNRSPSSRRGQGNGLSPSRDRGSAGQGPDDSHKHAIIRNHIKELQEVPGGSLHLSDWEPLFERLDTLGIRDSRVFVSYTADEFRSAWDSLDQPHGHLKGPGSARTQVEFWHKSYMRWLAPADTHQPEQAGQGTQVQSTDASASAIMALAESNKQLVSATKRLDPRRRRPLEEDSESDIEEVDLGSILEGYVTRQGDLQDVPSSFFGDLKRLASLTSKANKRPSSRTPYLSHQGVEEWHPRHIGQDVGKTDKDAFIGDREKNITSRGFATFLQNVITFWMAHLAARQVGLAAILGQVATLAKLAEERSISFAYRYHNLQITDIQEAIKTRKEFCLDERIGHEDESIIKRLDQQDKKPQKGGEKPLAMKGRPPWESGRGSGNSNRTRSPARRQLPEHLQRGSEAGNQPKAPEVGWASGGRAERRRLICLRHRPDRGQMCRDPKCLKEKQHLDTSKPDLLARFEAAERAHHQKKDRAAARRR